MTPGELIRAVRRRQGLSQAVLAARAGTSQPVVSAYERGHRDPTFGTLRRLIEAGGESLTISADAVDDDLALPSSPVDRGRRLLDVLSLVDAIPARPRRPLLGAPRMVSR
ncbi:MAG: helix-turn-helix domain-containing protein [Acidimicrobiales bacterium]